MKKFLTLFTITLTLALLLGEVFYPNFPLIWMASDAAGYAFIRAAIVVVLTALLFREVIGIPLFRQFLLVSVVGLSTLTAILLATDQLRPADGVIFVETAIVLSLEVLEAPAAVSTVFESRPAGKFGVGNDFVKIS